MNISSSIKLIKDEYEGFYSCGMTMLGNRTMNSFKVVEETAHRTVFETADGLRMTVTHSSQRVDGSAMTDVGAANLPDGVTLLQTTLTNNTGEAVTLEMIDSFVVSKIPGDKIHRFLSFWSAEGRHKVDDVSDLNLEHSWNHLAYRIEKFGNVGSMPVRKFFPFVAVEDSPTGEFTAIQLYSPASWQMEIVVREDDTITLAGGIADRDFGHFLKTLNPGETFTTPKALMARGTSLYEVCDRLVKAQNPDISPLDDHMGITFNEYCATWGDPNEANMMRIADALEGEGIQYLVMDSGWYIEGEGYWWETTGNWDYAPSRFPKGLKHTADYIRSKGMIPGIWYEFENVAPQCAFYHDIQHLVLKDGAPLSVGGRRFLDMEDEWVVSHLKNKVIDNLKDAGFGYIKVDYNDTMGMGCDGPEGMGENLRKKVLATQDFFRMMKKEIPELVIENCSSGGHRLEPSFMELSSMASFSDAHEILELPIIAASLQLLIKPEQSQIWAVLRKEDTPSRIYYSLCATLFGRMGLSGDIFDISPEQWNLLREGIGFYKDVCHIIKSGMTTLIHNSSKSNNHPRGGQLVIRSLGEESLVVYHRFEDSVNLENFIKNEGLDLNLLSFQDAKWYSKDNNPTVRSFGNANQDFSAEAWVIRNGKRD